MNKAFESFCLAIITLAVAYVAWRAGTLFGHVDAQFAAIGADVHALILPTQKAEAAIAATAITFAQVGAQERGAFAEQQRYYVKLTGDTDAALELLNATIRHFDTVVVPRAGDTLDAAVSVLNRAGGSVDALAKSGQSTLDTINIDAVQALPAIQDFDRMAQNGAAITDDGRKITDHYTEIILRPASKIKAGLLFAASIAGRVLRIF